MELDAVVAKLREMGVFFEATNAGVVVRRDGTLSGVDVVTQPYPGFPTDMSEIIAISSEGPTLNDAVDPRFGRAAGFVLVDEAETVRYLDNGGSQGMSAGQAGPQANPDNPALERQYLLQQAKTLENALASIKARLDALRPATDQA